MSRAYEIRTELADGLGDPLEVVAEFDRWNLIPREAWDEFVVWQAEQAEVDEDGVSGWEMQHRTIAMQLALARVFDASCRKLTIGGEDASFSEVSAEVRAGLVASLISARHAEGNGSTPSSGATSE